VFATQSLICTAAPAAKAQNYVNYEQPKKQGFFHRHPYLSAAGVGVFTGGIGGIVLGSGVAAGATTGAATHTGFHFFKDRWQPAHRQRE
jgi:hypothetical protein